MSSETPSLLGAYEVVRRLGSGGMAEVFVARKKGAEGTYKQLVVKRILRAHTSSSRFRTMFVEEAQLSTRLNHPNVVQVFEFQDGGDEGLLLAMEFVEGPDLGLLMGRAKAKGLRTPPWVGAWIISEAAKGLHYAHEKKNDDGTPLEIVHRDVSPQNILLSFEGTVKITDFGIASARLSADDDNVIKGKFAYMSPEQARGEVVDRRSDVFSLGVVLWEALTGKPLHGGLGGEALLDIVRSGHIEAPSIYVSDVPPELEAIVMKALEPRPEKRFSTARELSSAIIRAFPPTHLAEATDSLEELILDLAPRETGSHVTAPPPLISEGRAESEIGPEVHDVLMSEPSASLRTQSERVGPAKHLLGQATGKRLFSGPREVRHVALVSLRLRGLRELAQRDRALADRTLDRVRSMLGEIAFKRGVRAWVWADDERAVAVAGLTSNPTRATAEAAWLALDTHEVLSGMSEDLPLPIRASIGIVRGIASGTRDPHGNLIRYRLQDPANYLAEVVREATPVSRTWVAGGVYRLVRREFLWGDAPNLQLDADRRGDLPANLRIYALERGLSPKEWQGAQAQSDLVGREAEKADLFAAYHRAVLESGSGAITARAIVGELGIGKTALVEAFVSELHMARIFRVECSPVSQEVPLSAIAEFVRNAIGVRGDEPFESIVDLIAGAGGNVPTPGEAVHPMVMRLAELAANRAVGPEEEDPQTRKKQILGGLRMLVAALAVHQGLVIVFDGLQWADRQSQEILSDVLRSHDPIPVFLLIVTRPDQLVAPLLEGVVRIELRGLSAEEQVRLVELRLGLKDGVREVCADLLPKVGGNPFFLLEMVDALLERGALDIREERRGTEVRQYLARREGVPMLLPSTLEQLLDDRLRELPYEEHQVVDWLAISGGPLAINVIEYLMGPNAIDLIGRLCARGICDRRADILDFRHPLMRDVTYEAHSLDERKAMHRKLGEYLGHTPLARGLSAAVVGRHLARGDAGAAAAPFYLEAANAARNSNQVGLAVRHYARAIACLPSGDPRLVDAHDSLEGIYRLLGRRRERLRHLDALRRIAHKSRTGRSITLALLRSARFDMDEGRLTRGLEVARSAADAARAAKSPAFEVEAEALISEFLRELGQVQEALAACDRALLASDPTTHPGIQPRVRAEVLRSRGVLLRRVGRVREAVSMYAEAIAVFRATDARRQEARTKHGLAFAMFCEGRYEDAIALALESIQIDLAIGGRFQLANTLTNVGHAYSRVGDFERAKAYLERARVIHDRYGEQDGRADTLTVNAEVLAEIGEIEQADSLLKDAEALNATTANGYDTVHASIIRAILHLKQNEFAEAAKVAANAKRGAEEQALVSFHMYGQAIEAAARVEMGDTHGATLLATAALGVEHLQGCEYGLEVRSLAASVLLKTGSPQGEKARAIAEAHAKTLYADIKHPRFRSLFRRRPIVASLLGDPAADSSTLRPSQSPVAQVP